MNTYLPDSLDARAVLDEAIQPIGEVDFRAEPEAIFLSGLTGFVGAFLLSELLKQTQAVMYCLVRAEDELHANLRIRQNLEKYYLWHEDYAQRLLPVVGDLKLARFGLSEQQFLDLASKVDTIYHCGSKLSYVAPYQHLSSANVQGTEEMLRLATSVKPKAVHFVSSLGILLAFHNLAGGQENDDMDEQKCPEVGYFQTKYVAERLVRLASERGIPITVFRIGLIVGDSRTGVMNPDDFVARMIVGSILAGYAPDIENLMDMTPVDYVAKAMVYLSRQPESAGQVFHLLNPTPVHWGDIFRLVGQLGYPLQLLPFHSWVDALEHHADPQTNPLHPLIPFFHIPFGRRMLGISDSAFHALGTRFTESALSPANLQCSPISEDTIGRFLNELTQLKRIPQRVLA